MRVVECLSLVFAPLLASPGGAPAGDDAGSLLQLSPGHDLTYEGIAEGKDWRGSWRVPFEIRYIVMGPSKNGGPSAVGRQGPLEARLCAGYARPRPLGIFGAEKAAVAVTGSAVHLLNVRYARKAAKVRSVTKGPTGDEKRGRQLRRPFI